MSTLIVLIDENACSNLANLAQIIQNIRNLQTIVERNMRNRTTCRRAYKRNRLNKIYIMQANKQFVFLIVFLIDLNFANQSNKQALSFISRVLR